MSSMSSRQVKVFNRNFQVKIQMSVLKGFAADKRNRGCKKGDFYYLYDIRLLVIPRAWKYLKDAWIGKMVLTVVFF